MRLHGRGVGNRIAALPAHGWGLVALTALAAALRFSTLSVQSYWLDEAVTVRLLHHSLGGMLAAIPDSESTPPLYYVLAWLWSKLFGTGEAGLRSLSALFGTATVPLVYLAGARLAARRAGLVAAALAAVDPLLVWYSQEARAYALLVLLTTASLAAFARVLERPGASRPLAAWALLSALALTAHYFAVFVIVPEVVLLLWRSRGRRAPAAVAGIALAGAALLPLLVHQAHNDRAGFIRHVALGKRVLQLPKQFLVGFDSPHEAVATVAAAALAAYALWLLVRRADRRAHAAVLQTAAVGLAALAVPALLAVVGKDYLITRNVIVAWVPLGIVVAAGLGARTARRAGVVAAAALCLLMLAVALSVEAAPAYQREDWRGAARALGPVPRAARAVVITPVNGAQPLGLYAPRLRPWPVGATAVGEIDVVAVAERSGGQTPAPPRPPVPPPPPPGYAPARTTFADTFTLLRYRALGRPQPVAFDALSLLKLTAGVPDVVLQAPPGWTPPPLPPPPPR